MTTKSIIVALIMLTWNIVAVADNWPAWRGPDGQGQCLEKNLPLKWSDTHNVKNGAYPASDKVDPVDIQATIYHCMGLDLSEHMRDQLGRTWPLTTGQVIARLVG